MNKQFEKEQTIALLEAIEFASWAHTNQQRKVTGVPYVYHPMATVVILQHVGVKDVSVLQAAVLHDTVEDTDVSMEEIREVFGEHVSQLVKWVTEDKELEPKSRRKAHYLEQLSQAPKEAIWIALADKIHNLHTLESDRENHDIAHLYEPSKRPFYGTVESIGQSYNDEISQQLCCMLQHFINVIFK